MNPTNDFLSDVQLGYSIGNSAAHGFIICKWTGEQWVEELDRSEPNAVKLTPTQPGAFVGQMRSVMCEAPQVEERVAVGSVDG